MWWWKLNKIKSRQGPKGSKTAKIITRSTTKVQSQVKDIENQIGKNKRNTGDKLNEVQFSPTNSDKARKK